MKLFDLKNIFGIAVLIFVLIPFCKLFSQDLYFQRQNEFKVFNEEGIEWLNPWAGGLNAAQVSKIDLNGDGLDDLFVFDKDGNKIRTFVNTGSAGEALYEYDWTYWDAFPELEDWVLLRDYNCDGLQDIFTYSSIGGGMDVYKNTSEAGSNLSFELVQTQVQSLYEFSTEFFANLYISSADIPAIFDFEGDGDLDVLTFTLGGSTLELHLNYSVEEYGTCDSLNFKLRNRCYGQFSEGNETNSITLDAPCSFNVNDPREAGEIELSGGNRHVGSTVTAFDATGDGLPEIVLGDVSYNNLVILYNHDNPNGSSDSIADFNTEFPLSEGSEMPVNIEIFPAAYYEDIDNDGIRDLIAGTNNQFTALNDNSVWYYKNTGTDNSPDFEFEQKDFLQSEMIEVGKGAYPVIFDVNNDGLPDLLVSNYNYYVSAENAVSRISYFQNTGSTDLPAFQLITEDFLNLSQEGFGNGIHPSFGDYDGDGDDDLIIGDASGQLFLYLNTAAAGEEAEFEAAVNPLIRDENDEIIDVGLYSSPQLFDLNNDGLPDLVVGERNGNINYYENTGSETDPEFSFISDTLGGIFTMDPVLLYGNSTPHLYRIDGETMLFTGTTSGKIHHYSEIDGNLNGDFTLESSFAFHIYDGTNSKIFIEDVDNDGFPELFIGNQGGGLAYMKGTETEVNNLSRKDRFEPLLVFPNPGEEFLNIELPEEGKVYTYIIYDIHGKKIKGGLVSSRQINISDIDPGMYLLQIHSGETLYNTKFIKR